MVIENNNLDSCNQMNEFWLELDNVNYLAILQQFSPDILCIVLHNKKDVK